MPPRLLRLLLASALGLVLAAGIAYWQVSQERAARVAIGGDTGGPAAARNINIGGPFELVSHTGETVTDAAFAGEYLLVYFGFTFCPDVCPAELATMARAVDLLEPEVAEQVRPLFITIDPERDTPEAMAEYVDLFHPRMVGLTGSTEQVSKAAREYRVFYQKVEDDDFNYYLMDHSSFVYLTGPDGTNRAVLPPRTSPQAIAEAIRQAMAQDETTS